MQDQFSNQLEVNPASAFADESNDSIFFKKQQLEQMQEFSQKANIISQDIFGPNFLDKINKDLSKQEPSVIQAEAMHQANYMP